MKYNKIDILIQYALLTAGQEDEYWDRQLGPIHLIKYVYLADLTHAERNNGETYTGVGWRFYKFGPWSRTVNERIEPALSAIGATKKSFPSKFDDKDDWVRWCATNDFLLDELDEILPLEITSELSRDVHKFGHDTPSLLNHVYRTSPILLAAPDENLDFIHLKKKNEKTSTPPSLKQDKLTAAKKKELKKRILKLREKNAKRRSDKPRKRKIVNPVKSARYDDIYFEGLKWLDRLAGPQISQGEYEAVFSDSVWKSSTRRGADVS